MGHLGVIFGTSNECSVPTGVSSGLPFGMWQAMGIREHIHAKKCPKCEKSTKNGENGEKVKNHKMTKLLKNCLMKSSERSRKVDESKKK